MPALSSAFPDVLDPNFQKVFDDRWKQLPDMIAMFFSNVGPGVRKDSHRTSEIGTFGDVPEFTGSVSYDDIYEQYDTTITPKEYASGFQIQRKLFDDDLTGIMDSKPRGLATAYQRTRQKHAAQLFNNAFSVDSTWQTGFDGVALCSNSHTTRSTGVSTASGFDNLVTTGFSAVALAAIRIQMVNFRGDRAERISVIPDTIIHPPDLYEQVFEVIQSAGKVDTANNNRNVHEGRYKSVEWNYLTDANNYFVADGTAMKDSCVWFERVPYEFAMVEDFDTLIGKWRLYCRYGHGYNSWRWVCGAQVS